MKKSHSPQPKENMIETFGAIWKHASEAEREYIQKIWTTILKPAKVLDWKPTSKPGEYQLELNEEIMGNHPDLPLGELIVKKKMKIDFIEEKTSGNHYRQVIQFPDKGVLIRIGIGWLSKDSPLERLLIEEKQGQIWCTVEALGQSIARSAEETLAFWKKAHWNV